MPEIQIEMPYAATVRNMFVLAMTGPGVSAEDFVLRLNGVDTALKVTLPAGGTSGSDLVHSVAVAASDKLSLRATKVGGGSGSKDVVISFEYGP